MAKFNKNLLLLIILFIGFGVANKAFAKGNNSDYFKEIIFQEGGDFLNLTMGESKDEVMAKMPEDALDDDTGDYLYYTWSIDGYDYYIDLYFNYENKLESIDGYMYFYDKNGKELINESDKLYKDMKAFFVNQYGESEEETSDGLKYTYWYLDDLDVEVGMSGGEVYWYLYEYAYEDDYGYYDEDPTPVTLSDVGIGVEGKLMDLDISDSRVKVKSTLAEDKFSYAELNRLEYAWDIGANYYTVNYSFDENDKLTLIDAQLDFAYTYYYDDEEDSYSNQFYDELVAYMNDRYGARKEKVLQGETKVISWRFDDKEFVLGMNYDNVYWYYSIDE